ncbi:MAG TPA: hypothetical protein VMV44_06365 [Rectinemataceae bacterium]|nr:hypothetical protein [Rectinemataceae bacterium]
MRPAALAARAFEPLIVLVSGILLWLGLVSLDRLATGLATLAAPGSAALAIAAPIFVEEAGKLAMALAFMVAGRRIVAGRAFLAGLAFDKGPAKGDRAPVPAGSGTFGRGEEGARWPGLALAAIVVFATAENLSYLVVFPGADMFFRLSWSLPVHIAGAMALILALERGRATTTTLAILFAIAWHLAANAIASTGPAVPVLLAGSAASLIVIAALSRVWLNQLIIEGTVHGTSRRS